MDDERRNALGMELIEAAQNLQLDRMKGLLLEGVPVDHRHPRTGATAIHYSAYYGDWEAVALLLEAKCSLLIRDVHGRLPSRMAAEGTRNMEWADKLMDLEQEQGRAVGIVPRIRGDEPLREP